MTAETEPGRRPRAIVFAALPGADHERERLEEIKDLLGSAEIDWAGEIVQHRRQADPRAYLGPGRLRDLADAVKESGATCAVCEDDLSPAQIAAVLDAVDVDVLDRTELILSVFARHAHTLEGKLQVNLAQLEYELTRVRGKGHVLSRLGAGVDMRGPGETKLEVDRRVIRQRIQQLKRRIDRLARTRRTQRARRARASLPLIALAGYTNAGKSTLLNVLTDADVPVRDRLFETLDPTTRGFRFHDRDYLLTDTVGFIRKLPHQLVDAFASTLEETSLSDLLLVVVDAANDADEISERQETVAQVLDELHSSQIPRLTVMNKTDLLDRGARDRLRALYPEAVFISAATGAGLDDLRQAIAAFFEHQLVAVRLFVPYSDAGVTSRLRGVAADIREVAGDTGIVVEARLPRTEVGRFRAYIAPGDGTVSVPEAPSQGDAPEPAEEVS